MRLQAAYCREETQLYHLTRTLPHWTKAAPGVNAVIQLNPDALDMAKMDDCDVWALCSALCTESPFYSRITLILATKCKRVPARSRLSADPRYRIPPWLPICAPAVPSFLAKRICRNGRTSALSSRSAVGQAVAVKQTTPMGLIVILAVPVPVQARPLQRILLPSPWQRNRWQHRVPRKR